ncbi:MAG: N-6 DNA methylase [Anaerolineae bacterium]|nr:N-6 DNA methylase [Anaerolineae bacterium]
MPITRFANEYELQKVVQRCHNILWERHGFDPAQAFDEFSKLLFVKLYDETVAGGARVAIRRSEPAEDFAARVRWLFEQANQTPGFEGIFSDEPIVADDLSVYEVFRQLQNYSLLQTTSVVDGADIKGTIYENIVGNTFRGELGQFFTHRNIVEFMVRMVDIDKDTVVYDPACGSAGFLIMCAKLIRDQIKASQPPLFQEMTSQALKAYSKRCLIGTEINERTARVARLNLLMHGLDYSNIFTVNALKLKESDNERLHSLIKEGTIDVIFANPPFAGYEKDASVLTRFELGHNGLGKVAAVTREVLFVEQIIRLLRPGGMAGIVIPQGIFTNRNLARVREYIQRNAQILAVIELPDWAFIPSGTSVRGSLLFIRRMTPPPADYHIFMKRVEHIGFTSTGRPDPQNDFIVTLAEFKSQDPRYMVAVDKIRGRLDAKFYLRKHQAVVDLFRHNPKHKLVRLSDIGTFHTEKVNPRRFPDADFNLIETSCVDPATLTITPKRIKGSESNYTSLKVLRAGDILISRRRAYRGAIVIVPPELDGSLAIPEFSVLRLQTGIDRNYVVEILRSSEFLQLMTIYSTGEMSGRISEKDLRRLQIPLPEDHAEIGADFVSLREQIHELNRLIEAKQQSIAALASSIIQGTR